MITDGVEGYMFSPNDGSRALHYMTLLTESAPLRKQMRRAARLRFEDMFTVPAMVESVRSLLLSTIPPTVLIEVDNVVVDWDSALLESVGEGEQKKRSYIGYRRCFAYSRCQ
jgi:hypothetical protein